ncbi:MAG: IS256 family transposase [Actinomycetia bacterium]|nr:IS256 family transposase [Actinomycetes bacterium]
MKKLDRSAMRLVDETDGHLAEVLPAELAVELAGIAGLCREGLMAVAVEAGLATAMAMMASEAETLCGGWNARDPERTHVRGGTAPTSVVMGGQKLPIRRPRVRSVDGDEEVPLETFGVFSQGDLLNRVVVERMLAGVATRSFERVADPIGTEARTKATSTSKSTVSRRFVTGTKKALTELMARNLADLDPVVVMIDGTDFAGATVVASMIVTADGTKVPVGLRLGDTENGTVVTEVLADLVERGLDVTSGVLVVIDGGKALAAGVRRVFGAHAVIQRCVLHKRRNVTDHLPKTDRSRIDSKLAGIFADPDPTTGLRRAKLLATELAKTHPDAAGSLREGLDDMFTVRRLGIDGTLARTLTTTNMIESMFSIVDTTTRNVKRWRDEGDMRRRWAAAGMLEAETKFRRVKGYRQLDQLKSALTRHTATVTPTCHTDHNELAA